MPAPKIRPQVNSIPGFSERANELRNQLKLVPSDRIAKNTGCEYETLNLISGEFSLKIFDTLVKASPPKFLFVDLSGCELPEFQQLLLLYYFSIADGTPSSGTFVSFADLPGGRMYSQAFQGYSGEELVKVFGENINAFKSSCEQLGGQSQKIADAAYNFEVLPKITIQVVYWLGDDDFSSSCKILFDRNVTHYVPIDACALVGSNLAKRLIKNFRQTKDIQL